MKYLETDESFEKINTIFAEMEKVFVESYSKNAVRRESKIGSVDATYESSTKQLRVIVNVVSKKSGKTLWRQYFNSYPSFEQNKHIIMYFYRTKNEVFSKAIESLEKRLVKRFNAVGLGTFVKFVQPAKGVMSTERQGMIKTVSDGIIEYICALHDIELLNEELSEKVGLYGDISSRIITFLVSMRNVILDTLSEAERILMTEIMRHKRLYYRGTPEISDPEYDALEKKLRSMNPDNPVLQMVGSDFIKDGVQKVNLNPRMLSALKVEDIREIILWAKTFAIVWGFKIDGLSLQLEYIYGQLFRASTRGNGDVGENMTPQAFYITNIPQTIATNERKVIVRGEAFLPLSKLGDHKAARGLAVGAFGSNDPKVVKERGIKFYAWELLLENDMDMMDKVKWLKDRGFETADQGLIEPGEAGRIFETISALKMKGNYDFEMDGLVFKINSADQRAMMGETETAPRWMMAVKFPTEEKVTTIESIEWQVGRTGKTTPVAKIKPVEIPGATLSSVTMHNAKFVRDNKLAIGDEVLVTRSGDVIPYILKVISHSGQAVKIPTNCPACNTLLKDDSTTLFCTNPDCDAKNSAWVKHYLDKIGVLSLGEERINEMFEAGVLNHPADLYKLNARQWEQLKIKDRVLGLNGRNIYESLEEHKQIPFNLFIESLNIEKIGKKSALDVASHVDSWQDLLCKSILDFKKMGLGEVASATLFHALTSNKQKYELLVNAGITIQPLQKVKVVAGALQGIMVYVTGTPTGIPKPKLQEIIEKNGGTWGWSLTKTKILVIAPNGAGAERQANGKERGMELIKWAEFLKKYEIKT